MTCLFLQPESSSEMTMMYTGTSALAIMQEIVTEERTREQLEADRKASRALRPISLHAREQQPSLFPTGLSRRPTAPKIYSSFDSEFAVGYKSQFNASMPKRSASIKLNSSEFTMQSDSTASTVSTSVSDDDDNSAKDSPSPKTSRRRKSSKKRRQADASSKPASSRSVAPSSKTKSLDEDMADKQVQHHSKTFSVSKKNTVTFPASRQGRRASLCSRLFSIALMGGNGQRPRKSRKESQ